MNDSVVSIDDIHNNLDYFAKAFSESNPNLEKLLKEMWKRDFETIGCCAGHDDDETAKPYIAFKIIEIDKALNLISSINKRNIRIGLNTIDNNFNCSITSRNKEDIFQNIMDSLDKKSIDKELGEILDKMNNLNKNKFNNLIIYYDNNSNIEGIRLNTGDSNIINKLKDNYSYQKLNKHIYHFIIK